MATNFKQLVVWQKAMDLVAMVYSLTKTWPKEEVFGPTSQLRRAAVSVPSNIAEGEGRGSDADFVRFLYIAHGSLREVETQLLLSDRIGLAVASKLNPLLDQCGEVGRLLNGLIRRLQTADRRLPTAD
jgi:four helix bundle protein